MSHSEQRPARDCVVNTLPAASCLSQTKRYKCSFPFLCMIQRNKPLNEAGCSEIVHWLSLHRLQPVAGHRKDRHPALTSTEFTEEIDHH